MEDRHRPNLSSQRAKGARTSPEDEIGATGQVAHTLTACCRCRHRKTKCDPGLPRCTPCRKTNAVCDYFDASRGKKMPRAYILHLQDRVRQLEQDLASVTEAPKVSVSAENLLRGAILVRMKEYGEDSRFLGPSSGVAMTRLVMEMAKNVCKARSITEIVPEHKAHDIRKKLAQESLKPTPKAYPDISFVAAPNLPSLDLTERLVENFCLKVQYLYPILHEPTFQDVVRDVYQGSEDPYKNFSLRMVIAISMQKLDQMYAGLADSYYLAALPFLERTASARDLGTLQCLLLISVYSLTTPTRTAAYWVVGLATKLCQELRMTDEVTIDRDENGELLNVVDVDLRRRLFWVTLSMELELSHSLGRPSAFASSHERVNVKPFLMVDDKNIRPGGSVPGSPVSVKKRLAMHFMRMRLLQLEVRRILYTQKRHAPVDDSDPWFFQMENKLTEWMATCPKVNEDCGFNKIWLQTRYNTMVITLFRPSPQVPEPSVRAARKCFEACKFNISVQRQQISAKSVDLTWTFTQSLFMAVNSMLWTLSYPAIRKEHPRAEVDGYLETVLEALYLASVKWPGVESALELYITLVEACVKAYDGDADASYGVKYNTINPNTRPSSPEILRISPATSLSNGAHSVIERPSSMPTPVDTLTGRFLNDIAQAANHEVISDFPSQPGQINHSGLYPEMSQAPSPFVSNMTYRSQVFHPTPFNNPLSQPVAFSYGYDSAHASLGNDTSFAPLEFPNSRFNHAGSDQHHQAHGLDLATQSMLMSDLESSGLQGQNNPATTTRFTKSTSSYVT